MAYLSYAWTTPQLLEGRKTVTRRNWTAKFARQFRPDRVADAYDKSPRNGGKRVDSVRILSVRKEPLSRMTKEPDYGAQEAAREGFAGLTGSQFVAQFAKKAGLTFARAARKTLYRVEFELATPRTGEKWEFRRCRKHQKDRPAAVNTCPPPDDPARKAARERERVRCGCLRLVGDPRPLTD